MENFAQAVRACSSHTDWILALAWSPASEHHLLSASQDGSLKLWDTRSPLPLHTISSHTDKVRLCPLHLGIALARLARLASRLRGNGRRCKSGLGG